MNKYNSEGYYDPTAYEALSKVHKEEQVKRKLYINSLRNKLPYMPKVFICSPFSGDVEENRKKALKYCRFAVHKLCVPYASHLFFPLFLKENNEYERSLGIIMGTVFLNDCSEIWVFGNKITEGMRIEINKAKKAKKRIRYFTEECEEV